MELTFLGTGAAMPTGDRYQAGYVVADGSRRILVDCGSGVLHRLQQSNIGYEAIETVLLTHHHLDHVADLLPLMKARWLAGEERLHVIGPAGTDDLVDDLLDTHDYMQDRIDLDVETIEPGSHDVAGFDVEAVETIHSMPCLAYRFGDAIVLSGDTEPSADVAALADGCGVLVHDCAFPDDVDVSNHTRPSELADVLDDIAVGRVYLTHLYPHCSGREEEMIDAIESARHDYVRVPQDLQTIRVTQH